MNYKNGLWERVSEVRKNNKTFYEEGHIKAGREAEYTVRKLINKKIEGTGWTVFSSIRVPVIVTNLRREYDFIITSPSTAYVIELKNWSGLLEVIDGEFIQHRRYDNKPINHGAILDDLEVKVNLLKSYCKQDTNKEPEVIPLLVFYNENLEIPDPIIADKRVITYSQLSDLLPVSSRDSVGILEAILIFLGLKGSETPQAIPEPSVAIAALHSTLLSLGSWDVLEFNGGKISFGDILCGKSKEARIGNIVITDRKNISSVELSVDRSYILSLFYDLEYHLHVKFRDQTQASLTFPKTQTIFFQTAGSDSAEEVSLRNLKRFEFGYVERKYVSNPWESLKKGAKFEGRITGISEKIGIFVDIGCSIDGLLHISELKDVDLKSLGINEKIVVEIKYIDKDRKRIGLALPK